MRTLARAGLIALIAVLSVAAWSATATVDLDNGLRLIAVDSDQGRIAGMAVVIGCSIADEPDGLHGARALLQQIVVMDSHEAISEARRPASAFVDPRSSGLSVNTDWDLVEVGFAAHVEELDAGLRLLASHVFGAELTQERLEEARELVQRGYDLSHQSPVQGTFDLFRHALYGDHPMARPMRGDPQELAAVELQPLQAFRDTHYVPANAVLCVVAPLPQEEIVSAATVVFGALESRPAPEPAQPPAPPERSLVEVDESADLAQASMVVGVPAPGMAEPLRPAAEVIAALLEGRGGRLRRDLGLLQTLGLAVPTRLLREHYPVGTLPVPISRHAFLAVHALCTPMNIEHTRQRLLRHLLALQTGTATEEELERARKRVINAHVRSRQTPSDQALYLARRALFGLGGPQEAIADIQAVTSEDLTAVATRYFKRHAIGVQMPATVARRVQHD